MIPQVSSGVIYHILDGGIGRMVVQVGLGSVVRNSGDDVVAVEAHIGVAVDREELGRHSE